MVSVKLMRFRVLTLVPILQVVITLTQLVRQVVTLLGKMLLTELVVVLQTPMELNLKSTQQ